MHLAPTSVTDGITIDEAHVPDWFGVDPMCIALWCRPDATANRNVFGVEGMFYVRVSGTGGTMRILNSTTPANYSPSSITGHAVDQWRVMVCYWIPSTGFVQVFIVSPNAPAGTSISTTDGDFVWGPSRHLVVGTRIAANWSGDTGLIGSLTGQIGPIAVRRGVQPILADAVAMFDSKDILAPLLYSGGNFGGLADDDLLWFNVGFASLPGGIGVSEVAGAAIGKAIVNGNYSWGNKDVGTSTDLEQQLYRARPIVSVGGSLLFADHRLPVSDFFVQQSPGITTDGVVGNSPACARIGRREFDRLYKVGVISNSRGMRRLGAYAPAAGRPYWDALPGSHANGYTVAMLDREPAKIAGIIGAYLHAAGTGGASTRKQFVFDAEGGPFTSGTVSNLSAGWQDFRRFWTGSGSNDNGPGDALRMGTSSTFSFKARDMPDSAAVKSNPLRIRVSYLRFPGSMNGFDWENVEASAQNVTGTAEGPSGSVTGINTQTGSYTFAGGDSYNAGTRQLTIAASPMPVVGDAIFVQSGTGVGSIAEVESVAGSTVTLRHAFETAPSSGSVLVFGPWSFGSFDYVAPPTSADYRGPRITTGSTTGPLMLLSYCAWAEGVDGVAYMAMGWGGNGYAPQRSNGMLNLHAKITDHLGLDAVLLHGAYQSSNTAAMAAMAAEIEGGSDAHAVLCADQVHHINDTDTANYANYILGQTGYAGSVATEAEGTYAEQVALGKKMDRAHPNIYGMASLAGHYMDLWESEFDLPLPTFSSGICVPIGNGEGRRPAIRFTDGPLLSAMEVQEEGGDITFIGWAAGNNTAAPGTLIYATQSANGLSVSVRTSRQFHPIGEFTDDTVIDRSNWVCHLSAGGTVTPDSISNIATLGPEKGLNLDFDSDPGEIASIDYIGGDLFDDEAETTAVEPFSGLSVQQVTPITDFDVDADTTLGDVIAWLSSHFTLSLAEGLDPDDLVRDVLFARDTGAVAAGGTGYLVSTEECSPAIQTMAGIARPIASAIATKQIARRL